MQYTIIINQVGIVRAGLHKHTDVVDWIIIDYLKNWFFAENKKTILNHEDGKQYTWVNYSHLINNMPLIGIKDKDAISKRFKKLRQLGLIKTITLKDNSLFFILTDKCIQTCFYQEKGSNSLNSSNGFEDIPVKTDSQPVEKIRKNDNGENLSDENRMGHPMEIGQGVSDGNRTAQLVYQSNSNKNSNNLCDHANKFANTQKGDFRFLSESEKEEKDVFLENVLLTKEEKQKLTDLLGEEKTQEYIARLNDYIHQIGKRKAQAKYKSHYHVILNWHRRDMAEIERRLKVAEAMQHKREEEYFR